MREQAQLTQVLAAMDAALAEISEIVCAQKDAYYLPKLEHLERIAEAAREYRDAIRRVLYAPVGDEAEEYRISVETQTARRKLDALLKEGEV